METMGNLRRTHYSVALSEANVGEEVTVAGYVAKVRDLGAVVFCDVRDTKGVVQLNFGDDSSAELLEKAKMLRTEFVVMAKGEVVLREKANPNIPTGKIEIKVGELKILSKAETTPFEIKDDINVKDELKLKYRYLDLRRSKMHDGLIVRHKVVRAVRDYFDRNDFIEIETPVLMNYILIYTIYIGHLLNLILFHLELNLYMLV